MTAAEVETNYREHCVECGAVFTVDRVIRDGSEWRLHLILENTGQNGSLNLVFDTSFIYALNADEASSWVSSYPAWWAQQKIGNSFEKATKTPRFSLLPPTEAALPMRLSPGATWQTWLTVSRGEVPADTVALLGIFGPFTTERNKRSYAHVTHDPTRPFISLTGEVTVQPVRGLGLLTARVRVALAQLWASLWAWENLAIFVGMFGGIVLGTQIWRDGAFFIGLSGAIAGWVICRLLRWYGQESHRSGRPSS